MRAMVLPQIGRPLQPADLPVPEPKPGEVRLRVSVCGVCHTDLDEIEGRTPPPHLPIVLGHQVVGTVDALTLNS
jgi:propanol-preferring alcohol dehydrogenase